MRSQEDDALSPQKRPDRLMSIEERDDFGSKDGEQKLVKELTVFYGKDDIEDSVEYDNFGQIIRQGYEITKEYYLSQRQAEKADENKAKNQEKRR